MIQNTIHVHIHGVLLEQASIQLMQPLVGGLVVEVEVHQATLGLIHGFLVQVESLPLCKPLQAVLVWVEGLGNELVHVVKFPRGGLVPQTKHHVILAGSVHGGQAVQVLVHQGDRVYGCSTGCHRELGMMCPQGNSWSLGKLNGNMETQCLLLAMHTNLLNKSPCNQYVPKMLNQVETDKCEHVADDTNTTATKLQVR